MEVAIEFDAKIADLMNRYSQLPEQISIKTSYVTIKVGEPGFEPLGGVLVRGVRKLPRNRNVNQPKKK